MLKFTSASFSKPIPLKSDECFSTSWLTRLWASGLTASLVSTLEEMDIPAARKSSAITFTLSDSVDGCLPSFVMLRMPSASASSLPSYCHVPINNVYLGGVLCSTFSRDPGIHYTMAFQHDVGSIWPELDVRFFYLLFVPGCR